MPVSHGNTRDSKLDTTPAVQARLTAGGGQGPRITGRNLARLSREASTFRSVDYHPACSFRVYEAYPGYNCLRVGRIALPIATPATAPRASHGLILL